jgi:hypothetical protein
MEKLNILVSDDGMSKKEAHNREPGKLKAGMSSPFEYGLERNCFSSLSYQLGKINTVLHVRQRTSCDLFKGITASKRLTAQLSINLGGTT